MDYKLETMRAGHRKAVIDVFNYFIENSFAAYNEEIVGYNFFDVFVTMSRGYPAVVVRTDAGEIVGFAFLSAFHSAGSFGRTASISYFILPDHTRHGIGEKILERFEREARGLGVDSLLAHISSRNPLSIAFHEKNGFVECGRFQDVGEKFEQSFDMIWMQKRLTEPA